MLNSLSDLHGYVDKGQLTGELGGSLEYCHSQWIHHRTVSRRRRHRRHPRHRRRRSPPSSLSQAIENFAVTVKTAAQMLQRFGTELAETELPNDIQSTKELLGTHTDKHSSLKVRGPPGGGGGGLLVMTSADLGQSGHLQVPSGGIPTSRSSGSSRFLSGSSFTTHNQRV